MLRPFHAAMIALALLGGGCAVTQEIETALFDTRKVNLAENSYAAADMLAQQAKAYMTHQTPLSTVILSNVAAPEETTPFGQQVANHLGARFVQLGYNVQALPLPPGSVPDAAPMALSGAMSAPPPSRQMGMQASNGRNVVLTGSYTRGKNDILVSLRMIQLPDQRVIAAYDYTLPLTGDLRPMSMTAAEHQKAAENPVGTLFGAN
ncbi:MAG: hypothetical protein HYU57_03255 [Micavibrio aeruginosavorus]|nr:hypothetical protein [Micavibrio aeruginosavorus]